MKRKIVISFFATLIILSLLFSVNAATISELQSQKKQLEKDKQKASEQLKENKQEQSEVSSELEKLNTQISDLNSKISDLEIEIDDLNKTIDDKTSEISEREKKIEDSEELLKKRLVALYKSGGISYLDVLLSADSYLDMLTSYSAISQIVDADTRLITSITDEKEKLEAEKSELEASREEVESKKNQLDDKNDDLKSLQSDKKAKISSLTAEQQKIQKQIDSYNSAIRASESKIIAQQNAAKGKINSGASSNKSGSTGGHISNNAGAIGWPLPSRYMSHTYITSYFGPRRAPTSGASTNHGAIDIGIPTGTGVYAAESGYIVACGWYGGYGNYIRIWHKSKGEFYTCYGHLSGFKVSVGDYVGRGDLIALSGSTGISTGPHLHFEVRVGGSSSGCRVDPLNYLPSI